MGKMKLKRKPNGLRGPTPTEPYIWGTVEVEKRPSDDWLALHRAAVERGEDLTPDDEDLFVGVNIYGHMAVPKKNAPVSLWPQGRMLLLTLTEVQWVEFRAECLADIERQKGGSEPAEPVDHKADLAEVAAKALEAGKGLAVKMSRDELLEVYPPPPAKPSLVKRLLGKRG